jgi:23S rRNA pseudouridine2604 synthase
MIRLNKHLKDLGICSRRQADEFITNGYILVNGKIVTKLGLKVDPLCDIVTVSPRLNQVIADFRYILLNKPIGYVCSKSTLDGKNIFELLPNIKNLTYAGRLDKDSHGLIILSNDGKFVYKVAASDFPKEYIVRVNKPITNNFLLQLSNGSIRLDNKQLKPAITDKIDDFTYRIILNEGVNRQIRRMAENQGYEVVDLKRVSINQITDSILKPGAWRELSQEEISSFTD